jgi:hypothetical protein
MANFVSCRGSLVISFAEGSIIARPKTSLETGEDFGQGKSGRK